MGIITSRLFKQNRRLYYIIPSEKEIDDYYDGVVPEILAKYINNFGTYDYPSLYIINKPDFHKEVLGIEFRADDERVICPDLDYIELEPGFLIQALYTDDKLERKNINNYVSHIKYTVKDNIFHNKSICASDVHDVVEITCTDSHNKITIPANKITKEEFFEKRDLKTLAEQELYNMIYHEPITGHNNWNYLWPIIAGYGLTGIQDFQFVHFDIKDFKAVNIVYNYATGDDILIRIAKLMRKTDWIYESARCHNDNFAMMIKDMPEEETREKLNAFFDKVSHIAEDPTYKISYRCGVVPMKHTILLGDKVADAGKLVQRMCTKKYETEIKFFNDEISDNLDWSSKIKAYLETALKHDEFVVYYQPKINVFSGEVYGAEALVRWVYHGKKFLSPGNFIPILETGGLINKVDDVVLDKVCKDIINWQKQGLNVKPISVNLSRERIGKKNLVDYLTNIVDSNGVDHSLIEFEITESAACDDMELMIRIISGLRKNGFRISLDDCGTKYSTLSSIASLPINTMKMDKAFSDGLLNNINKKDCAVFRNLVQLAKDLGLECIAEGVEDRRQIELLKVFGCEIVQGYYYSKPIPEKEYEDYLKK